MTNKKKSNNKNSHKKTIIVIMGILVAKGLAILVAHIVDIFFPWVNINNSKISRKDRLIY